MLCLEVKRLEQGSRQCYSVECYVLLLGGGGDLMHSAFYLSVVSFLKVVNMLPLEARFQL